MNRLTVFLLGWLVLSAPAFAGPKPAPANDDHLIHSWKQVNEPGAFKLVSTYPAPVPFSMHGDPEATLEMEETMLTPEMGTLEHIVKGEVAGIRSQMQIAEYDEKDGKKPVDGIATWYETINGTRVAFIKYRVGGVVGGPAITPITVIHSIIVRADRVFFTHLLVRFADHQDEVRHDQRVLIHAQIRVKLHSAS